MVEVTKKYLFTGPDGEVGLADLFEGRRQLIVYHFMRRHAESGFPGQDQGCPTCSFVVDSISHPVHLHYCGTTLALVSRAPQKRPSTRHYLQTTSGNGRSVGHATQA